MDFKGQVALEYLMIFFVLLVVFSAITLPLILNSLETVNEVECAIETKSFLVELQRNVKLVHSMDVDSKRSLSVNVPCDLKLFYQVYSGKGYLSATLTFSDNSRKVLRVEVPCEVSFNGHANNHYVSLKKSWYYNVEVRYVNSSGVGCVNVNFK